MTSEASKGSELLAECSDDELYKESGLPRGKLEWAPKTSVIVDLFAQLDQNDGLLPLEWKCPGRRPPTPTEPESEEEDEEDPGETEDHSHDFDFEADEMSTPTRLTPRSRIGSRELKGSARKKTTSLNSILSNMKRHRKEQDGTPTSSKS